MNDMKIIKDTENSEKNSGSNILVVPEGKVITYLED
jgi:hypothetical protein